MRKSKNREIRKSETRKIGKSGDFLFSATGDGRIRATFRFQRPATGGSGRLSVFGDRRRADPGDFLFSATGDGRIRATFCFRRPATDGPGRQKRAQTALKIGDLAPKKGPGATREYRSAWIRRDPAGSGGIFFAQRPATGKSGGIRRDPAEIFVHLGRRGNSGPRFAMAHVLIEDQRL